MKYTHVYTTTSLKTTAYGLKSAAMDLDELGYDVDVELKSSPYKTDIYTTLCLTPKDSVTTGYTNNGYNFWKSVLTDLVKLRETQYTLKNAQGANERAQSTLKSGLARVPKAPTAAPTVQDEIYDAPKDELYKATEKEVNDKKTEPVSV